MNQLSYELADVGGELVDLARDRPQQGAQREARLEGVAHPVDRGQEVVERVVRALLRGRCSR